MKPLKQLKLIVKPTHRCNLNCQYCFDRLYQENIKEDMTLDTVEVIAQKAANASNSVIWIWHGGECTLVGADWLEEAMNIIRYYNQDVHFRLQSNGVLLDDLFLDQMINRNKVDVSISYDGLDNNLKRGSSDIVHNNFLKLLEYSDNQGGCISVIGEHNIDSVIDNYEYMKSLTKSFSFNLVFPATSGVDAFSDIEGFTEKYIKFFDYWFYDQEGVRERTFLTYISLLLGEEKVICSYGDCLGSWLGINPIGDIYQCDRYFSSDYQFGNVRDYKYSLYEVFSHPNIKKLRSEHASLRLYCLQNCKFSHICLGGCKGTRILRHGVANKPYQEHCYIFKALIKHVFMKIKDLEFSDYKQLNPQVSKLLINKGHRSMRIINKVLLEEYVERKIQ